MTRSHYLALMLGAIALHAQAADTQAPPTARVPVVDHYGDLAVADPYRWLEDGSDPKVHQWSLAQDKRTRAYFDKLPARKPMFARLMKQIAASSSSYYHVHAAGGQLFAMYNQPPKQQPMIAVLGRDADPKHARVVLDPNVLNPKGTTAIDWYVPAPDGKHVAVSMSDNGSEDGSLHVIDATGKETDKVIPRVQYATAGGSVAWRDDGSGFWYTRYPDAGAPAERQHFYQQIWYHHVGDDPSADKYVAGKDFPKVAEIALVAGPAGTPVVAEVANGDGGEYAHYLLGMDGSVRQVTRFEDKVVAAVVGADGLYLISRQGAPKGKLLKLELDDLALDHARTLVPESDAVMQVAGEFGGAPITVTPKSLYVREVLGGPSRVAIFDHDGKPQGKLPLPDVSAVDEVESVGDGSLLVSIATYLAPPYFARYDEASGKSTDTLLRQTSPVSFGDAEVVREFAISKDGTRVPLNIVRKKGLALDGSHPLLLYGYGGFSVSLAPRFLGAATRLWLDAGGVYVIANLRGGGEYGEAWHEQGALTHKQNVFDDLAAAGQIPRRPEVHELVAHGGHRRQQRRPADGRGAHAASRPVPRGRLARGHLRHAARGARSQRLVQRHRVRQRQGSGAVAGADRVLAVPPRGGWHGLSGDLHGDRRDRRPREPDALAQDDRAPAGRDELGPSDPPEHQRARRSRHRQRAVDQGEPDGRRLRVPVRPTGNEVPGAMSAA